LQFPLLENQPNFIKTNPMNVVDYMDSRNKLAEHLNAVTGDRDILVFAAPMGEM
jgi:hypothetical protein